MRVIISAAGTGGHINPGIAIANKIREKEPNSEIIFIGTDRGLENDLVPRAGYELKHLEAYGFKKEISIQNLKNILKTLGSTKKAKKIIEEFNPDLVLGTGGYICGPVFAAATSKKIPTMLHESNAYPGKAVNMFAKKVDKVLVGFEDAKNRLEKAKEVVVTGTPTKVRKVEISEERKKEIYKELGINNKLPVVLVFGGSQGAQAINNAVRELIKDGKNEGYQMIWAAGPKQYEEVAKYFSENNMDIEKLENVKVLPYIYNMEEMMNISDLFVCRSGAMTITEISIVGKPAIFIPLPSMSANRQEDNARVLEKLGAASIILNNELKSENLAEEINKIVKDEKKMKKMGKLAEKIAPKDVEEKIYKEIKKTLKNRKQS